MLNHTFGEMSCAPSSMLKSSGLKLHGWGGEHKINLYLMK